ncbi:4'-phosphopantetheinyl transferase superfamily protein [Guyparkeria halophila]|uniref:Enterobactin synthase component D n=1 Tax=Guyparkeria halophila TaxID=47960 RepID=A0ABZ0YWZ8_9GAMM|nr:4'-phosphopantetheinyl transferase superfamily protein [Guyparkeria halophila]WQH16679.1 4'-phosphopantetheinyl transferase superfamily protein [Guyparkeria halophila]
MGVGVDVENFADADRARAMERLVIRGEEHLALPALGLDRRAALSVIFSAKESFFKAAFPVVCRFFDFDALALVGAEMAGQRLIFRLRRSLAAGLGAGRKIEVEWRRLPGRVITATVLPANPVQRAGANGRGPAQPRCLG